MKRNLKTLLISILVIVLSSCLCHAETLIISNNATPPASMLQNNTNLPNYNQGKGFNLNNATSEQLDELILAINDRTEMNERYLIYVQAKENRSDKLFSDLNTNLKGLSDTMIELQKDNRRKDAENKQLNDNLLNLQNKFDKFPLYIGISIIVAIVLTVYITRIYMLLRHSKKAFTIIRFLRAKWPFVIGSPDVTVGTSKEETKPNFLAFGIVAIVLIVLLLVVLW